MPHKPPKNNRKLDRFVQRPNSNHRQRSPNEAQQQIPENRSTVRHKRIINLTDFLIKSEATAETIKQQPISLRFALSEVQIHKLFKNCKPLSEWAQNILPKNSKLKERLQIVIQRFFKGSTNSLWSNKYQPRTIEQIFDQKSAQNISLWIKSYTRFRNSELLEQSNSFIDDVEYNDEDSSSLLVLIQQNNWKCKALVVKGKSSIGKTSIIRVVSKELNYKIHECSADLNQEKYLKQNNESTKSENIQIMPRNLKIQKNNHNLSKYFPHVDESKSEKQQRNALQFIRDFDCVYPEKTREKFCRNLNESIASSKIPFVLSTVSLDPREEHSHYDYVEMQEPRTETIAEFFWMIYNVEKNLSIIDFGTKVRKEDMWIELNSQLGQNIPCENKLTLDFTIEIVKMFQSNLSRIYNFMQFRDINDLYRQSYHFIKRTTSEHLLQNYFDKQYLQSKQRPTQSKQSKTQQGYIQNPEKQKYCRIKQFQCKLRELELQRLTDAVRVNNLQDSFHYHKLLDQGQGVQDNLLACIPVQEHWKAKQKICQSFKTNKNRTLFSDQNHISTLRPKQMHYLPMLAVTRKSRKAMITFQETLNKFIDENKTKYLLQFMQMI